MSAEYFAEFDTVRFEGPDSTNDLAYRWYDKDRMVMGKTMEDHLRFAVCMWHTFCWPGSDVFGAGTFDLGAFLAAVPELAKKPSFVEQEGAADELASAFVRGYRQLSSRRLAGCGGRWIRCLRIR